MPQQRRQSNEQQEDSAECLEESLEAFRHGGGSSASRFRGNGQRLREGQTSLYASVIDVRANDDSTLHVEFGNGDDGIVDMTPRLGFGV